MVRVEYVPSDVLELDRVAPPPDVADPTLVVWREWGRASERLRAYLVDIAIWLALVAIGDALVFHGVRGAWPSICAGVLLLAMGLVAWVTVRKRAFTAVGSSWLVRRTADRDFTGPPEQYYRSNAVVKFDDVRRVYSMVEGRGFFRIREVLICMEDGNRSGIKIPLTALQNSPPLMSVLDAGIDWTRVDVDRGLLDEMHRAFESRRWGRNLGQTVVRSGKRD